MPERGGPTMGPDGVGIPLSAEQELFWLASLDGADDPFLILSLGYRLHGELDRAAFSVALSWLQASQEVFHCRVDHGAEGARCVPCDGVTGCTRELQIR